MRVVVAGGGIGGLACAQGLVRRGFDVAVAEPDQDLSASGGYKLHLGVAAVSALRDLLLAASFESLLGSAVATLGFSLVVRDHRGRRLLRAAETSDGLTLDVDRVTLRQVLASGLDEHLLLGRSCRGWRVEGETVVAELDDGGELEADVLVIADGACSPLTRQLAGGPTSSPCGLIGVAGRSPWQQLPRSTQSLLGQEPMLAIGPGGTAVFGSAHDPVGRAALRTTQSRAYTRAPVAIWGLIAVEGALPPRPSRLDAATLLQTCTELLRRRHWAEPVLQLLNGSDLGSVSAFRLHAADPQSLAPWPASRVTALGDAVHVMPPTGGQGAATAILGAHALVDRLGAAARHEVTTLVAIHDYEARLRALAAPAVRDSLQPLGWIRATATPAGAVAMRSATPVVAAAAAVATAVRRGQR